MSARVSQIIRARWFTLVVALAIAGCAEPPPFDDEPAIPGIVFVSMRDGIEDIYVMDADGRNVRRVTITDAVADELRGSWVPAWSPDGGSIVFASNRDDGGGANLYVVDSDGSSLHRLTHHGGFDYTPDVSPDGAKIAFMSNRGGFPEVYVMYADGSDVRRLTHLERDEAMLCCPDWSPDGARIVFHAFLDPSDPPPLAEEIASHPSEPAAAIHVMDADGSNLQAIRYGSLPRWSPDGAWIAFVKRDQVHVMRADGSEARHVTDKQGDITVYPVWSPDGERIAFTFIPGLPSGKGLDEAEIYVIDVDGSNTVNLTSNDGVFDGHANWW